MGESTLQHDCCRYARKHNVLARKVHCEQRRGWPDLLLIFPVTGKVVFVEMKNPNGKGKLARLQKTERRKILDQGASVYVCDSFSHFVEIIQAHHIQRRPGVHAV